MESKVEKNGYAEFERNRLLSRKEAAEYLGIMPNTLAVWHSNKRYALPVIRIGRLCKYKRSDLVAFTEQQKGGSK